MAAEAVDEYAEVRLMADGCTALMRLVFGDNNWYRWNEMRRHTRLTDFQSFVTWLLDVADQQLTTSANMNMECYPEDYGSSASAGDSKSAEESQHKAPSSLPTVVSKCEPDEPEIVYANSDAIPYNVIHAEESETSFYSSADLESFEGAGSVGPGTATFTYRLESKSFFCDSCQVSLSDTEIVREHTKLRHPHMPLRICCGCCQREFTSLADYINYHKMSDVHKDPAKPHVCDYCAKAFSQRHLLEDHIANKHLKLGPRHECSQCGKKFSHGNNLRSHMKKCASYGLPPPLMLTK